MKIPAIVFLFIFAFGKASAQTPNTTALADSLLKAGTFKAVTITYDFPKDVKLLQQKAIKNLKNDPRWADRYIVTQVERGDRNISYMEEMGLTREEFNHMRQGFMKGVDIVPVDTFNLTITKTNGIITFKVNKKAVAFNQLKINTKTKEIIYFNSKLTKEIKQYGQKFFAPKLFGYEAFSPQEISPGKGQFKNFGFSAGVNEGETRPTLVLLLVNGLTSPPDIITISIL